MAEKSFAINTEPHRAVIGDDELLFQPEVIGAEFAEAYSDLKEAQSAVKDAKESIDADVLNSVNIAMRGFLKRFMLPESADLFETLKLPDRVLVQLLEWTAELYGGGAGKDRAGSSGAS